MFNIISLIFDGAKSAFIGLLYLISLIIGMIIIWAMYIPIIATIVYLAVYPFFYIAFDYWFIFDSINMPIFQTGWVIYWTLILFNYLMLNNIIDFYIDTIRPFIVNVFWGTKEELKLTEEEYEDMKHKMYFCGKIRDYSEDVEGAKMWGNAYIPFTYALYLIINTLCVIFNDAPTLNLYFINLILGILAMFYVIGLVNKKAKEDE